MIKKALLIITLTVLFKGCNINPNKEARIQQLESEIQTRLFAEDLCPLRFLFYPDYYWPALMC